MNALLTVPEVAGQLRKSVRFIHDEIRRKNLRAAKVGSQWLLTQADVDTYVEAHMNVSRVKRAAS